jgi:hypothetical protein
MAKAETMAGLQGGSVATPHLIFTDVTASGDWPCRAFGLLQHDVRDDSGPVVHGERDLKGSIRSFGSFSPWTAGGNE